MIYFYENENYCNPPCVTEKIDFSIDKLVEYKSRKSGCKSKRGEARSQIIKDGYFDNFDTNHRKKFLTPIYIQMNYLNIVTLKLLIQLTRSYKK